MPSQSDDGLSEPALVVLAQAGDPSAFEELVRRRQAGVRGLLRQLCADAAQGDDLAQDTFVRAWQSLHQLREPEAFGGWLRRIAVRIWLNSSRGQGTMESIDDHEWPEHAAVRSPELRLDLDAALARLRAPERLCLLLAYSEDMSHSEVSQLTGIPLGTVKSHIARGAARLRKWLGQAGGQTKP